MKRLVSIIVALTLLLAVTGCQEQSSIPANDSANQKIAQLTMKEKMEDFESLYKVLEENYPFFDVNKRMNGVDWLANKNKYINMINMAVTEQQYEEALDIILKDLNNGHVDILRKDFYLFLRAALERIENMPAWKEQLGKPKTVIRYSDINSTSANPETSENQTISYITPNNISNTILFDKKVAYLRIATLNSFNIEEDMKVIRPFVESIKDYHALIIDIRGNGGGDSNYWSGNLVPMLINKPISYNNYYVYRGGDFSTEFIKNKLQKDYDNLKPINEIENEKLSNIPPELLYNYKYYLKSEEVIRPKDSIEFKGNIYLLVDRRVYSSSEMFASFAKDTGFATLVGEITGGDGIGQDPLVFSLPNSGYVMRFPMVMGLTADGSCNEEHKTIPDIKVAAERTQDIAKDKAIQYVLNLYK